MSSVRPFHLAMPTNDLKATIEFYTKRLSCKLGRQDSSWVDLDFFGHQLVFHYCGDHVFPTYHNPVDSKQVQLPHFGVVLIADDFWKLAHQLESAHTEFIIEPYTRFKGTNGEQSTMFFLDPNGYALEFKSFADDRFLFEPF